MSSRAAEITLFILLIQASVGFVNATGMFTTNYYDTPQNQYSNYSVNDLNKWTVQGQAPSLTDYLIMGATWIWDSFFIVLQIIGACVFVLPFLVWVFNIPLILAAFLQVGIYYTYAVFYAQQRSGKGWKLYE